MTIITFSSAAVLAVAGVFFLPIVNDRWDDPIGISVLNEVGSLNVITKFRVDCDGLAHLG